MDAITVEEEKIKRNRTLMIAVVCIVVAVFAIRVGGAMAAGTGAERVEREHEIQLPASADQIQTMGDASNPIWRITNLDRGASSIFTLQRSDVHLLLAEFNVTDENIVDDNNNMWGGAPGNSIYQPSSVPWTGPDPLEASYTVGPEVSAGDFSSIEIYRIDDSTVGVWLYTDWN